MKLGRETKVGCGIVLIYLLLACWWPIYSSMQLGTLSVSYAPKMVLENELLGIGEKGYIFGTDVYGRSVAEILFCGLSYSLFIGLLVSSLAALIGLTVGFLIAFNKNYLGMVAELITDVFFIFPSILIAILIMSYTGQSITGLIFSLVLTGWPSYAKISRGESLRVIALDYVESARAIGSSGPRLFLKTIFPAILPVLFVHFVLGMSGVIVSEAALGFLGLGGSEYSWGVLLSMAKTVLLEAPHITVVVSTAMAILIIGLNLLGDGLRDDFDPKGKR